MNGAKWVGDKITDRILGDFAKVEKGDRAVSSVREETQPDNETVNESGVSDDQSADVSSADRSVPEEMPDDSKEPRVTATVAPTHGEQQSGTVSGSGLLVSSLLISINVLMVFIIILIVCLTKKIDRIGQHANGKNSDNTQKGSDDQGRREPGGKGADNSIAGSIEGDKNNDKKHGERKEPEDTSDDHNQESQGGNEPHVKDSDSNSNDDRNESPQDLERKRLSHRGGPLRPSKKKYLEVTADSGNMGNTVLSEVDEGKDAPYIMSMNGGVEINPDIPWYKNGDEQTVAFLNQIVKLSALFDLVDENGRSGVRMNDSDYVRITRMVKAAKVRQYGNDWVCEEKGKLVFRMDCSKNT